MLKLIISRFSSRAIPWMILRGPLRGRRWSLLPSSGYWRRIYEPECSAMILKYIPDQGACWDIGAHFGFFSILMAVAPGKTREVVALEPSPWTFERLTIHLLWNKLPSIRAFQMATSDEDGTADLLDYGNPVDSSNHLAYTNEWTGDARCRKTPVRIVRMDTLRMEQNLQPPGLIKIDVEGHGVRSLRGMEATLRECLPVVIYSVHTPEETEGMNSLLAGLGYHISRVIRNDEPDSNTDYLALPPGQH